MGKVTDNFSWGNKSDRVPIGKTAKGPPPRCWVMDRGKTMGKNTVKGKGKHLRVVGKEDRLTPKQEAFAMQVAKGAMLSEAYRECYSAEGMRDSTIWSEACKLAQNPKVTTRIKAIQADMEADRRTIERRREEWVLKRLTEEADQAETDGARIRAIELVGRTIGMFTDRIEQADDTERSASDIEADLRKRLDRLMGDG